MGMAFLIFMSMLFCHVVDDFYLQGVLAEYKQKEWWEKNCPGHLYRNDWKVSLMIHAFSWTFMVQLPIFIWMFATHTFTAGACYVYFAWFAVNFGVHCYIDNAKANKKIISLFYDQVTHFSQIVLTWAFWCSIVFRPTLK